MQSTPSPTCPDHGTRDASGDYTCRTCGATWDYADGSEHPRLPAEYAEQSARALLREILQNGQFWPSAVEREMPGGVNFDFSEWAERARAVLK